MRKSDMKDQTKGSSAFLEFTAWCAIPDLEKVDAAKRVKKMKITRIIYENKSYYTLTLSEAE